MAKKTSIINVVVAGDSKPLRNALGKATKSLGTMTKQIGKFSLAAGAAFATVGAKSIGLAVDFEESLSKANQIFGDAAKGIETSAKGAATAVGLSQAEFLEAASSFGVFGKAAGLTGDDLSMFSTDLVTLSADVASFNNLKPEEALDKLNAGLRGSVEPLQSIGVLMTAAAVEAEGLNMGLIEQGEKLSEGQKIMARHSLIMQQLGSQGATGDFARTSEGLANQQRILNARLKDLGTTLGIVLLPIAVKMASAFADLIGKFEEWSPAIQTAFDAVVNFLTPIKEFVGHWAPLMAGWLKGVIADSVIPALVTAFTTVKDVIKNTVIPAVSDFIEKMSEELPETFDKVKEHLDEHKELYKNIAAGIGGAAAALLIFGLGLKIGGIIATLTPILYGLAGGAGAAGISMAALATPFVAIAGALVGLAIVSPKIRKAFGEILDFLIADIEKVIDNFGTLFDLIGKISGFILGSDKAGETNANKFVLDFVTSPLTEGIKQFGNLFGIGATGGIVTQPTLSLIGEAGPEAVIPLNQMPGASPLGAMGGMNITVNLPAGASGEDVVQALENYVRRNGSIPLATNNLVRR